MDKKKLVKLKVIPWGRADGDQLSILLSASMRDLKENKAAMENLQLISILFPIIVRDKTGPLPKFAKGKNTGQKKKSRVTNGAFSFKAFSLAGEGVEYCFGFFDIIKL